MSKTLKSEHNTKLKGINTVLINCWLINVEKGRKVSLPEHIHCSVKILITTHNVRSNCLKDHVNKTCKGKICQVYICGAHFALKQIFLTFNLSTHVNVSTNSKYWISLAFNFNSTLSIPAINVIVTPFFSKLVTPRAVYGISKYSTSRWVGNLENLMKNAKQQTYLNTTA